jgi:hypothetical protein
VPVSDIIIQGANTTRVSRKQVSKDKLCTAILLLVLSPLNKSLCQILSLLVIRFPYTTVGFS